MCNYWANFFKTGDPNGLDADGTPMPEWKPFSLEEENYMYWGDVAEPKVEKDNGLRAFLTKEYMKEFK